MMEFETRVRIEEDFKKWSRSDRLTLIKAILNQESWEFEGEDTVTVEPPERC